ncbi:MAG: hypothetical protein JNL05_04885 [Flavobacteriales bacterium]|nr:hypothetical protein [Flavobacteriales bacterium]
MNELLADRWQPFRQRPVYGVLFRSTMERNPSADRSSLILTSGIVSGLLAIVLFCLAYLVL